MDQLVIFSCLAFQPVNSSASMSTTANILEYNCTGRPKKKGYMEMLHD